MTRLYRLMLFAYPAPMRRAHGRDMVELFADLVREAHREHGILASLWIGLRAYVDLPLSARQARRMSNSTDHAGSSRSRNGDHATSAGPPQDPRHGARGGIFDSLLSGLGYTVRSLRRSPGFAFVVIFTLAVGIGANTVMFTVLDGILLTPLPYEAPDRLVRLYQAWPESPDDKQFLSGAGVIAYRERTDIFEGLATAYTYRQAGGDLTTGGETARIVMMEISADYFGVLGVEPLLGREFLREEETDEATVAVISYGLWQTAFAGSAGVLGEEIDLQGVPYTVVGVMPSGFRNPLGGQVDLWRPENLQPGGSNRWNNYYLSSFGRLRDGVTLEQARDQLQALGVAMQEEEERTYGAFAALYPLLDDTVGDTRTMLWVLMGAVGLVLMIVCVNVASLFLVRSAERGKELAIRAALGAGRRRLVAQMLTESLVLGLVGGLAGLLVSFAGLRAVVAMSPDSLPRVAELGIDARIFVFATVISVCTGVLFGIAPALRFSRPDLESTLRSDSRSHSGGAAQRRLRAGLVVAEIAFALVLLFGAGLLTKSFGNIVAVDLGVEAGGVLTYEVHLPESRYAEGTERSAFYERFFEQVRSISGVESVGATSYLPTEGRYNSWSVGREGTDLEDGDNWTGTDMRVVDGDYLQLMGIELVQGRLLGPGDSADVEGAMVINESLATLAFPDVDPLGKRVTMNTEEYWSIVGIVADTAHDALGSVSPKAYIPHAQYADNRNWPMTQTVRTATEPGAIVGQLRAELQRIDPQLVLYRVRTMQDVVARGVAPQRFTMALMMSFAATALLLAAVGIYGVLSYSVAQRTHEIGIRVALGADRAQVRGMVLRQGLILTGIGVVLGIGGALALTRWLSALLFEVDPGDPTVLGVVALLLALVATLAGYLPARRATAVDPIQALSPK